MAVADTARRAATRVEGMEEEGIAPVAEATRVVAATPMESVMTAAAIPTVDTWMTADTAEATRT
jgi:hypothetical protein